MTECQVLLGLCAEKKQCNSSWAPLDTTHELGEQPPRTALTSAVLLRQQAIEGRIKGTGVYLLKTIYFIGQQQHHAQVFAFVGYLQDLSWHVLQLGEAKVTLLFHHLHRLACVLQEVGAVNKCQGRRQLKKKRSYYWDTKLILFSKR